MKSHLLIPLSFVCLGLNVAAADTNEISVERAFPPAPEPLIDLFAPPTRSKEPYAASARQVFEFRASETNWASIRTSAADILGIAGYAKNSAVLYVVSASGLATTRDGGRTWAEVQLPSSTAAAQGFVGVSVHPTSRREAILVFTNQLLITKDFGESLNEAPLPENTRTLRGAAFIGADPVRLVVLTDNSLLVRTTLADTWNSFPLRAQNASLLETSMSQPAVLIAGRDEPKRLTAFDLANSSVSQIAFDSAVNDCSFLAPDLVTNISIWAACGDALRSCAVANGKLQSVAESHLETPIKFLRAHPRVAGSVFVVLQGNKETLVARAPASGAGTGGLWGFSSFAPVAAEPTSSPSAQVSAQELETLTTKLIAAESTLDEAIGAALKHGRFSLETIARWEKRARRRHWIPELRVTGGARELTVDRIEQFDYVDRFGIPQREDLRITDGIQPMGYAGVALVWDLSRLYFDRDEVEIGKQKRAEIEKRDDLVKRVTTLYYERLELRARLSLRGVKMTPEDRISLELKLRQKTDLLNQLAGRPLFQANR